MWMMLSVVLGCSEQTVKALDPDVVLTTQTIDFGEVVINTREVTASYPVQNDSRGSLTISDLTLDPTSSLAFTLGEPTVTTIDSDGVIQIPVTYAPTRTGLDQGWFTFATNDPTQEEVRITLIGDGVAPDIDVDPETHNFGERSAGSSAQARFTIEAHGVGKLKIYAIEFADPTMEEAFSLYLPGELGDITYESPLELSPGSQEPFDVIFEPLDDRPWDGSVIIHSNADGEEEFPVRVVGNTEYKGEEPPTVEILTPDWGNYFVEGQNVTLEGSVIDDADAHYEMGANWYARVDGEDRYLGAAGIDEVGYTSITTEQIPPGVPVTITLTAQDTLLNVGQDSVDVTVWEEEEPVRYVLSGGGLYDYWRVDDDVTISVDGEVVFSDTDHASNMGTSSSSASHPPVEFDAKPGQIIRIEAVDYNANDLFLDALTLHWGTDGSQQLNEELCRSSNPTHVCYDPDYHGPWPGIFLDESYEISIP